MSYKDWNESMHAKIMVIIDKAGAYYGTAPDYQTMVDLFTLKEYTKLAGAAWILADLNGPDMEDLLARKQHDYGHQNIMNPPDGMDPADAVRVRLWDKLARLRNLAGKDPQVVGETLTDTYMDIVGYCVILMMLRDDSFTLPLRGETTVPDAERLEYAIGPVRLRYIGHDGSGGNVFQVEPYDGEIYQ